MHLTSAVNYRLLVCNVYRYLAFIEAQRVTKRNQFVGLLRGAAATSAGSLTIARA
jgi:hypothetical protein